MLQFSVYSCVRIAINPGFVSSLISMVSYLFLLLHVCSPDTRRIFVDIGLGFHVEFTWSEALNYISQREEKIARYKLLFIIFRSRFSWKILL